MSNYFRLSFLDLHIGDPTAKGGSLYNNEQQHARRKHSYRQTTDILAAQGQIMVSSSRRTMCAKKNHRRPYQVLAHRFITGRELSDQGDAFEEQPARRKKIRSNQSEVVRRVYLN